jgi:hypothetical protein
LLAIERDTDSQIKQIREEQKKKIIEKKKEIEARNLKM